MKFIRLGIFSRIAISLSIPFLLFVVFLLFMWNGFVADWQSSIQQSKDNLIACNRISNGQLPRPEMQCDFSTPPPSETNKYSMAWLDRTDCDMFHRGATDELLSEYQCNIPKVDKSLLTFVWEEKLNNRQDYVWLCVAIFIVLTVISLFQKQSHIGIKRLSILISLSISFFAAYMHYSDVEEFDLVNNFTNTLIETLFIAGVAFTLTLLTLLLGKSLFEWVKDGFQIANPIETEPKAQSAAATAVVYDDKQEPQPDEDLRAASFWDRFWARGIDLFIVFSLSRLLLTFSHITTPLSTQSANVANIILYALNPLVFVIILCILIFAYDYIWLLTTGTTLGKAMFSIRVISKSGNKLSRDEAYNRAIRLLRFGLTYMLFFPFIQFFNAYQAYKFMELNNTTKWDSYFFLVKQKPIGNFRRIVCAAISLIALISIFPIYGIGAR